jgi:hypothetical protein
MAVISHANRICFVDPRNGNKHGAKDLLTRQSPVVRRVRENGGDCVIALAKRPLLRWETPDHDARFGPGESFLDVTTHFIELLLVDDVTCLVERITEITELERFDLLTKRIKKIVKDVAVEEKPRARGTGLALSRKAHCGNDAVYNPIFVCVGEND